MIKKLMGIAVGDSCNKTVKVRVDFVKVHPLYQKRYVRSRKFLAQTEKDIKKGQKVTIRETRPISKKKAWKVIE